MPGSQQEEAFGNDDVPAFVETAFAPWVRDLGLRLTARNEAACTFAFDADGRVVRQGGTGGGVVCGQALAAAADTVAVIAFGLVNGRLRPCTTTDLAIRFMRPVPMGTVELTAVPLSNGKRMAVCEIVVRGPGARKPAAHATCTLVWLD